MPPDASTTLATLTAQIKAHANRASQAQFVIGHALGVVRRDELWRGERSEPGAEPYTSFRDYIETSTGLSRSTAYLFLNIATAFSEEAVADLTTEHLRAALTYLNLVDVAPSDQALDTEIDLHESDRTIRKRLGDATPAEIKAALDLVRQARGAPPPAPAPQSHRERPGRSHRRRPPARQARPHARSRRRHLPLVLFPHPGQPSETLPSRPRSPRPQRGRQPGRWRVPPIRRATIGHPGPRDRAPLKRDRRFCRSAHCPVVYFHGEAGTALGADALKVRVGHKEHLADRPICYCFGHSAADLQARPSIGEEIKAACKRGEDRCAETNPQGSCCLGNVAAVLRDAS